MSETYKLVRTVGKNDARKTDGKNTRGYTRYAKVARVDPDGTAWVDLSGDGTSLTPATLDTGAKRGDVVRVSVSDHAAHVTGNMTSPATDDTAAEAAQKRADEAARDAESAVEDAAAAREAADEANKVAQATNQHFFADTNGAHITDVTQDEWNDAVADEFSDYDPDTKPYHNQLLNSLGILLRTALNNLVSITRSAIAFYDGAGNSASNIVARFGSGGAQIGVADGAHSYLAQDYHSLQMVDKDGDTYLHVSDLRGTDGYATLVEVIDNPDDGSYEIPVAFPPRSVATTSVVIYPYDPDEGVAVTVVSVQETQDGRGIVTVEEEMQEFVPVHVTYQTDVDSAKAFTFGSRVSGAAVGGGSFAAGRDVTASGTVAQAVGVYTTAVGEGAHAEGDSTFASGRASHAEGDSTSASGSASHAEGRGTSARGDNSHAQGEGTAAWSENQTAMGRYNAVDANGTYALIIGNGTGENACSNAFAVKWDGTVDCGGIAPKWVTIDPSAFFSSVNSGWTNDTSYTQLAYSPTLRRVVGRFRIYSTAAHSTGNNVIGTVAVAYRPYVRALCCTTATRTYKLYLDANGNATLALDTATTATQTAFYFVADYTMA